jgi:hypothetical protein
MMLCISTRALVGIVLLLMSHSAFATYQDAVPIVGSSLYGTNSKIPAGYDSYSLFLLCNPQWLEANKGESLVSLYSDFQLFGEAIGHKNAAIWFWKGFVPHTLYQILPANIDLDRSKKFCNAWHLAPEKGPYIVVTSQYPDEDRLTPISASDNAVFALGSMKRSDIESLLEGLSGSIRNAKQEAPATQPAQPGQTATQPSMWVTMLTAVQQTISKFGCAWTFKIDAGPVKADLQSCKPQGT